MQKNVFTFEPQFKRQDEEREKYLHKYTSIDCGIFGFGSIRSAIAAFADHIALQTFAKSHKLLTRLKTAQPLILTK